MLCRNKKPNFLRNTLNTYGMKPADEYKHFSPTQSYYTFRATKSIKMYFNKIKCDEVEWLKLAVTVTTHLYSAVHGFWPVEELAELADGPAGCGEVAKGWVFMCLERGE